MRGRAVGAPLSARLSVGKDGAAQVVATQITIRSVLRPVRINMVEIFPL